MISGNLFKTDIYGHLSESKVVGNLSKNNIYGTIFYEYSSAPPGPTYDVDAQALFNRMTVQPSTALKELIEKTIIDLKTAGIWQITDKFHKWDLHTEQASLLDWKNASHNATNINNATFNPKDGLYTTNYTNYVSLNFIPSADCIYGSLDDISFSLDDLTAVPTLGFNFGGYSEDNTSSLLFRTNEDSVKRPWLLVNAATWRVWNNAAAAGNLYVSERLNSSQIRIRKSPVLSILGSSTSVKMVDNNLVIGGFTTGNGSVSMQNINTSLFWLGKMMTEEQVVSWYDIINYWKANISSTF